MVKVHFYLAKVPNEDPENRILKVRESRHDPLSCPYNKNLISLPYVDPPAKTSELVEHPARRTDTSRRFFVYDTLRKVVMRDAPHLESKLFGLAEGQQRNLDLIRATKGDDMAVSTLAGLE